MHNALICPYSVQHGAAIDAYVQKDWKAVHALRPNRPVSRIHAKIMAFVRRLHYGILVRSIWKMKSMKMSMINTHANVHLISMVQIVIRSLRPIMCLNLQNQAFTTMSNSMDQFIILMKYKLKIDTFFFVRFFFNSQIMLFLLHLIQKISFCTWIQTNDSFNYGTIFSYATDTIDNMFTLTDYNG